MMKSLAGWLVFAGVFAAGCSVGDLDVVMARTATAHVPTAVAPAQQAPATSPRPSPAESCKHASLAGAPALEDSAPAPGPTLVETFNDAGCVAERHTFRYDAAGRVIEQTYRLLDPTLPYFSYEPRVSFHHVYEYDARGNKTLLRYIDPDTGKLLSEEMTTYDDAGRKVYQRRVGHNVNASQGFREERWTYHSSGELERREFGRDGKLTTEELFVRDASGAPLERYAPVYKQQKLDLAVTDRWTYDSARRLKTHETTGVYGGAPTITRFTYGRGARLIEKRETGLVGRSMDILWRYDERGREISRKSGVQGQGFEYETKTAYNKHGDKISESSGAIKPSKPPKEQRTSTWSFDAQRRPTAHRAKLSQGDKWRAEDTVWSWSADGTGLRTNTESSRDAVARVTARAAVRMRGAEVVVLWEERYAQDSAAIYRTTNTYDAAGRLIRVEQISGDETSSTDYTYDAAGRLVSQRGGLPRRGDLGGISRQEWRFR